VTLVAGTAPARFQLPQLRPGFHAQLRDQHRAPGAVHVERLGAPAAPVHGEHQVAPELFAQRVLRDDPLQLVDGLQVPAKRQLRAQPHLEGGQPALLEPVGLGHHDRRRRHVVHRRATPQRQRLDELCHAGGKLAGGDTALPGLDEPLEHL
jgi:hypothetical protein